MNLTFGSDFGQYGAKVQRVFNGSNGAGMKDFINGALAKEEKIDTADTRLATS